MIKAPAADPMQSLQGKVAGLQVLNSSGEPGAESNVRLRGINTLNDNRVLYVVDGVIIDGGIGFLNSNDNRICGSIEKMHHRKRFMVLEVQTV